MEITEAFADPALEQSGVWFPYRANSQIKIARLGNPQFTRILEAKMAPYRQQLNTGRLPKATETKLYCEALAEAILLDWKGFTKNKQPLPYSRELAVELLVTHQDFRNDVVSLSASEDGFRKQAEAETSGN